MLPPANFQTRVGDVLGLLAFAALAMFAALSPATHLMQTHPMVLNLIDSVLFVCAGYLVCLAAVFSMVWMFSSSHIDNEKAFDWCIRKQGHDGPCNGLPRPDCLENP